MDQTPEVRRCPAITASADLTAVLEALVGTMPAAPEARVTWCSAGPTMKVAVVRGSEAAALVLRDPAAFLQWDGAGLLERGGCADPAAPPVSRGHPDIEAGPYCMAQTPLFLDPPEHTRLKRLVVRAWRVRESSESIARHAASKTREVVERALECREVDIIGQVAIPVACATLAALFGDDARAWEEMAYRHPAMWGVGMPEDGVALVARNQERLWARLITRGIPRDNNAVERMLGTALGRDRMTLAEIQIVIVQMMIVATSALVILICELALAVITRTPDRASLRTNHRLLVDRLLAQSPPQRAAFRRTVHGVSILKSYLPPKTGVLVSLAAARPASDQDRSTCETTPASLAFGAGIHQCPGAPLVLAVAEAVAAELDRQLAGRLALARCTYEWSGLLYGPRELQCVTLAGYQC